MRITLEQITPEEVARNYESQAGYDLVDYGEIALPLWQMSVEALSIAHRSLPPISEFVMRSLDIGLCREDIGGFLGLDDSVVDGVLTQLDSERMVRVSDASIELTDIGRRVLAVEGIQVPIEEQISILFDGVTRLPIAVPPTQLATAREIEDGEVVEIDATPATKPTVTELRIADVVNVLHRQAGGRRDMGRDILRFRRIARQRRTFRRGVGLIFLAKKTKDLRAMFIVEGIPQEDLQTRFAEEGLRRPGFVRAFSDAYLAANIRRHLGTEISRLVLDFTEYDSRQKQLSTARLRLAGLRRRLALMEAGVISEGGAPDSDAVAAALNAEREALDALGSSPVRPAAVYECVEFLRAGLTDARKSIAISSIGLAPHLVDRDFVNSLTRLLQRGVSVDITVHERSFEWIRRGGKWARAYSDIDRLARQHPSLLKLHRGAEDRFFYISWDERTALVGNRPFLSNQGRIRNFEQFAGFVMQRKDLVGAYLGRVLRRVT